LDRAELTFGDGSSKEFIVTHEGTVDVSSGAQKVEGVPVIDFKEFLKKEFPAATSVGVKEFKDNRFSVLGEVFHQIHTELGNGPMRLMDAIASANGFTPLADKQHVRLVRENAGVVETYEIDFKQLLRGENMSQNIMIEPGDVITVPRNFL
jgi:polysaccharide export outer membrane protein